MQNSLASTPKYDRVYPRQLAFIAAFLLPAGKLLEAPSLLSRHAAGDLLLPAILHYLLQTLLLLGVLYAASRSEKTLLERLESKLGRGIIALYILYAAYFLFAAVLPLLDLEKFVYAAFFDTAPSTFSFAIFFFFSAYTCAKGFKSIGRSGDICLFLFALPFFALILMSFAVADFSNLLPLFGTNFQGSVTAFSYSTPLFSDVVLLLPLIVTQRYQKNDGIKISIGYWSGALLNLLFLAVFYGVYASIAPREHYAFSKIAQYFPALNVVGRIDLLFVYLLTIVIFFYTCLPLQYTTQLIARISNTKRKTLIAAILNIAMLFVILFFNRLYDTFYTLISSKLFFVFWLIADMVPLFFLFLPADKPKTENNTPRQKEKSHA